MHALSPPLATVFLNACPKDLLLHSHQHLPFASSSSSSSRLPWNALRSSSCRMMNMSEDCTVLDPLMYHPESRWFGEAFTGENEGLVRVLRISPSETSSSGAFHDILSSSYPLPVQHQLDPPSLADAVCRRVNPLGPAPADRVSKRLRRSRPSKRSPTTYIKADPANFRQMVQWVTGVRLGGEEPGEPPMLPMVAARTPSQQLFLPTLDTSAVFLDREEPVPLAAGSLVPPTSDFDLLFPGFPTLESWGDM